MEIVNYTDCIKKYFLVINWNSRHDSSSKRLIASNFVGYILYCLFSCIILVYNLEAWKWKRLHYEAYNREPTYPQLIPIVGISFITGEMFGFLICIRSLVEIYHSLVLVFHVYCTRFRLNILLFPNKSHVCCSFVPLQCLISL